MNYLNKLKIYKNRLFSIVFLITAMVIVVSLLMPQYYGSTARLLVIQKQTDSLDAYLAAKSAEKVGDLFSELIYSTSFFERVWAAGYNIGNDWGNSERERRNMWKQRVELNSISQTSLLELKTYGTDKLKAEQLSQAVIQVLTQNSADYYGDTDKVQLKLVDKPITSRYPVKPNLIVNAIEALVLGLILGLVYIYLKPMSRIKQVKDYFENR